MRHLVNVRRKTKLFERDRVVASAVPASKLVRLAMDVVPASVRLARDSETLGYSTSP